MDENREAWIALNLLPDLSPTARARLVEVCGGPAGIFAGGRDQLATVSGLRRPIITKIASFNWKSSVCRELELCREAGFEILTPADPGYPGNLGRIYDPPPALYLRGSLEPRDERAVAVVGSRRPSVYGLEAAREFGRGLARRGATVVSGLAIGADSAAHRGALEMGGRTLAVLGSGVDVPYPRRNRRLLEEVAQQGAVLSEFPLGTEPMPWNFPRRNRVIAGLALGTVVVEASARSGSLVTAREALDAGREVFAVPGRVTSELSVGTNYLIRAGHARLVMRADDVLEELPGDFPDPEAPEEVGEGGGPALPREEAAILARLPTEDPVHVDSLAGSCGMAVGPLMDALLSLEMRRLVRAAPGGRYVRVRPGSGRPQEAQLKGFE